MNLSDEIRKLKHRVDRMEKRQDAHVASDMHPRIEEALREASARFPFSVGERVGYVPARRVNWQGRVIPLPVGARTHGKHGELLYVLRDDNAVRGCYPWNLVRM